MRHSTTSSPAFNDLLAGQVQVMFPTTVSSIGYIRASRLRALAVTTATRSDVLPDIPTVGEFLPGYESSQWYGVGAPKNTAEVSEPRFQYCDRQGRRLWPR